MKRSGPIKRRTRLAHGQIAKNRNFATRSPAPRSRLKQSRSTGKPTKAQAARIDRLKRGECVCCWLNRQAGRPTAYFGGCDAHHLLSGGVRRGHDATLACCPWHHRGIKPYEQMTEAQATEMFGPSLAHGSKPFRVVYGSDDVLLSLQEQLLALDSDAQEAP